MLLEYIIGTRGSQLSLAQTNWVVDELKKVNSETIQYRIQTIKTTGDTSSRPLFTIDQKGIFEKEIDMAVSDKKVDFAVHSLKDIPSTLPTDLTLACIPKRESVNDVLITKDGHSIESLPSNSIIGTSSLRRAVQLTQKRPDVTVKPIRGNIETRIKKISKDMTNDTDNHHPDKKHYDGIILAMAGLVRLDLTNIKFTKLSTDDFSPSPGQGALGIVTRTDNHSLISTLQLLEDPNSRLEIEAERTFSNYIESGCRFPVGAFAKIHDNSSEMTLTVIAFSVDGKKSIHTTITGHKDDPQKLGSQAAKQLQEQGVSELALNWREKVKEWNKQQ
jgi:hydroxymethylbilane synthase